MTRTLVENLRRGTPLENKAADELERLQKLVRDAYNEGFTEGMREHTSSLGGKPWQDSSAARSLKRDNGT